MTVRSYREKVVDIPVLKELRERLRGEGKVVVFTNGCFDVLHAGHVDYLDFARKQGDVLVVGLNSDASTKRLKGESRPVVSEGDRAKLLASFEMVDYVIVFDDDEPLDTIKDIVPDVLVKGEDWEHYVSGREVVEENGGKVVLAPLTEGRSTTGLVEKIRSLND